MRRLFWFLAGAATATYLGIKGREYYRRLTPEGMREQVEQKADQAQRRAKAWAADFADTYTRARSAKRSELMGLLTRDERRQLT